MRSPQASSERQAPAGPPSSELALAEGLRDALVLLDADWRITFLNARARESVATVGLVPAEMVGRSIWESFPALEHSPGADELRRARTAKGSVHFEQHDSEKARWYEVDAKLVGDVMAVYWRDVTEQRRLEAQLRAAQKMEAVGLLAGGVAHDFNNLLTAIKGFASLLQMTIAPTEEDRTSSSTRSVKASDRAAALTAQLLAFSRRQLLRPEPIDLNARVRGLERMLGLLVSEGGELELELDPALGLVLADPGQVEQIVLNLAVNARDAIAGRRRADHHRDEQRDAARRVRRWRVAPAPGEYVRLDVRDNGVGMDAATQARIFEPFFTTKAAGHGTGLGLATVYGIAKQSGGYVWVQSAPGEGSTFTRVPAARRRRGPRPRRDAREPPGAAWRRGAPGRGRGWRAPRRAARARAARAIACIEAADGARGLDAGARHASDRPAGHRRDDARHARSRAGRARCTRSLPRLPVLYMSGHAEEVAREGLLDPSMPFLAKPFTPISLARQRCREVLEASRPLAQLAATALRRVRRRGAQGRGRWPAPARRASARAPPDDGARAAA